MKFEEKLMKLRKENALSQEELAEKLDVTRQTISKWELGQTKPDADKIVELAKLFNVSTDELLSETEEPIKSVSSNNENESKKNTIIIVILIIALVVIIGGIGFTVFQKTFGAFNKDVKNVMNSTLNDIYNHTDDLTNTVFDTADKINERMNKENEEDNKKQEEFEEDFNKVQEENMERFNTIIEEQKEFANKKHDEYDVSSFNSTYKNLYTGVIKKIFVIDAINRVISDNLNNERKITVVYNEIKSDDSSELAKIISKLNKEEYLLTYDYDANGYICQMNISDV